MYSSPDNTVHI